VKARDRDQDGRFYFGVLTTGVYCRPSCPARLALRKNVRFYETPAEAERDGLRACLRCRPLAATGEDANTGTIRDLCRFLEDHCDASLRLEDLGRRAGLSPFHLQRSFKAIVGVTPRQYQEACRLRKLKGELRSGGQVTGAIFEAGYGSISRVYEKAGAQLGMTPLQYRRSGKGVTISYAGVESPLGPMMIGATDRGLCFVQFGARIEDLEVALRREYPAAAIEPLLAPYPHQFELWMGALFGHLEGQQVRLELPVDVRATAFQMKVWRYLQTIPYGEVQSYGEVAAGIGQPSASRAVASACASNRVAIVIPCHRVIRGTGELGGYRWGVERKRVLIDQERAARAAAR
jgi:AraC family transcriptional regulator of adaptative response/methylated-DNA-[protein]-cysteine methyltransferase